MIDSPDDRRFMGQALALARAQQGRTAPNPAVGCVIVKAGQVVGQGATGDGGRPHAEPQALRQAGAQAQGSTVYVTLEPCAHHGQTPPCVEAILAAKPARVVVATPDPDPRTAGQSLVRLQAAGIATTVGVMADEAAEVMAGFFHKLRTGQPLVVESLDGQGCDAPFVLRAGETAEQAIQRYAQGPETCLWVKPGSPEAI